MKLNTITSKKKQVLIEFYSRLKFYHFLINYFLALVGLIVNDREMRFEMTFLIL